MFLCAPGGFWEALNSLNLLYTNGNRQALTRHNLTLYDCIWIDLDPERNVVAALFNFKLHRIGPRSMLQWRDR